MSRNFPGGKHSKNTFLCITSLTRFFFALLLRTYMNLSFIIQYIYSTTWHVACSYNSLWFDPRGICVRFRFRTITSCSCSRAWTCMFVLCALRVMNELMVQCSFAFCVFIVHIIMQTQTNRRSFAIWYTRLTRVRAFLLNEEDNYAVQTNMRIKSMIYKSQHEI